MLERMEVRASRVIQGDDLAIDNRVGWKVGQALDNVGGSFIEILAVARVQNRFATGSNSDGAVARVVKKLERL